MNDPAARVFGMNEAEQVYERTWLTVLALAREDLPLRARLWNAYVSHLAPLEPGHFPPDLRPLAGSIHDAMTWAEGPDGSAAATMDRVSDEQARKVAALCVELFEGVCRHLEPLED